MFSFSQIGALLAGGITGTLLRYTLAGYFYKSFTGVFPWGTLAVNLCGCLAIGLLWGALNGEQLSQEMKNLVFIGLLGAFTTYSAYALDTLQLFRIGQWKLATLNVLLSNLGGIGLAALGFFTGRFLHSRF